MKLIAEGKTKKIFMADTPGQVIIESKDDLTAGDGLKHDIIRGKATLSNRTTCNVFRLLKTCGLPLAFIEELDGNRFLSEQCEMIPYEVVVRREAHGSFLKRHPHLQKGHVFPHLLVEFFLKTAGKQWKGTPIPKDDPFIKFEGSQACLYLPDQPIEEQTPFLVLDDFPLRESPAQLKQIEEIATEAFLMLEKAWQGLGRRLVDFKIEFGLNAQGELRLADVIDNDSWRVLDAEGKYIDKQVYRDGGDLDTVTEKYRLVAELTGKFQL